MAWVSRAGAVSPPAVTWVLPPCANEPSWQGDGFASPRRPARVAGSSTGSPMIRRTWRMPPEPRSITVLLVEDHVLVAEGLAAMLAATGDLTVIGSAAPA